MAKFTSPRPLTARVKYRMVGQDSVPVSSQNGQTTPSRSKNDILNFD